MLVGSAGRGDADFFSDVDLLLYVDELPPEEIFAELRAEVGGANPLRKSERTEHFCSEEFDVGGIRTEVSFMTTTRVEWRLDELLGRRAELDSPVQKVLAGLLEGLPLHGDDLVERWRARLSAYPEPLRRAMVERYWSFFPLWYYADAIAARDAELWRIDVLIESAFNLLGVLAGLNGLYYSRFELKRMRALIGKMQFAPARLADRLESLFRLEPEVAAAELGRLVEETRALVVSELPDVELPLRFPPGTRQPPWSI